MSNDIVMWQRTQKRIDDLEEGMKEAFDKIQTLFEMVNEKNLEIINLKSQISGLENHADNECTHQNRFGDSCQDCGRLLY